MHLEPVCDHKSTLLSMERVYVKFWLRWDKHSIGCECVSWAAMIRTLPKELSGT